MTLSPLLTHSSKFDSDAARFMRGALASTWTGKKDGVILETLPPFDGSEKDGMPLPLSSPVIPLGFGDNSALLATRHDEGWLVYPDVFSLTDIVQIGETYASLGFNGEGIITTTPSHARTLANQLDLDLTHLQADVIKAGPIVDPRHHPMPVDARFAGSSPYPEISEATRSLLTTLLKNISLLVSTPEFRVSYITIQRAAPNSPWRNAIRPHRIQVRINKHEPSATLETWLRDLFPTLPGLPQAELFDSTGRELITYHHRAPFASNHEKMEARLALHHMGVDFDTLPALT